MAISSRPRVLITGGSGFIGSHLSERYLNMGWDVICLDNFFTGDKANIVELMKSPYFELVRHDIIFPYFAEVDLILNFACPASPVHYQYNAIKTVKTAVLGTLNMLGLAKRVRARFVQASTSEVYGDPQVHPQTEEYWGSVNPIGIRSCYDEGKRIGETLCFDYFRQNKVDVRVLRIFNTYGPRMALNDGRVVSNFLVQAIQGRDIEIYGSGDQTRSFCYIDDLVDGIVKFAELNDEHGPLNLGNDHEFSIRSLAQTALKMTQSSSKLIFKPLPQDDPKQRQPDLTKARHLLNWLPKTSLEDGLRKSIPYFKERLAHKS